MTATSQTDGAGEASKVPVTNPEPTEPKTVPLGEHIELRKKFREADERIAKLESALAAKANTPDPATQKAPQGNDDLRKDIEALKTKERLRSVSDELGLGDPKQVEKVSALMDATGLNAREALAIMAQREPEAFADVGQRGGAEASFASLAPRPGSSPQPKRDEVADRRKFVQSLKKTDRQSYNRYLDNQIGGHLADALGWEHKLLDIPKQQ